MSQFTSGFWDFYIGILTIVSIVACGVLLWSQSMHKTSGTETSGHVWDEDIREYNNPMPAWWMWLFWLTIAFGFAYLALYPGLGSYPGSLGWTQVKQLDEENASAQKSYGPLYEKFAALEVAALSKNPEALAVGQKLFLNNCAQCHASDGGGSKGFPNLTDGDWLWGGTPEAIKASITEGRTGMMPPLGPVLGEQGVKDVSHYVLSLSGQAYDSIKKSRGETLFRSTCAACHGRFGLAAGSLRFEIMVETPQNIIGPDGTCPLPAIVTAGAGRITAAHFGTYDYTAGLGITAEHQHMRHPACDFAKQVMQVALAGTGVWLSDGSTTVLPVPPIRAEEGKALTKAQNDENTLRVHQAWRKHYDDVMHSLAGGFYQGWDLHPAQLVTRYAALFRFFSSGMTPAAARLKNFVEKAAQATLVGDVFDDAATGQGLLNYFLRAINCGAATEEEVLAQTGLTLDELRGRSFPAILRKRTGR